MHKTLNRKELTEKQYVFGKFVWKYSSLTKMGEGEASFDMPMSILASLVELEQAVNVELFLSYLQNYEKTKELSGKVAALSNREIATSDLLYSLVMDEGTFNLMVENFIPALTEHLESRPSDYNRTYVDCSNTLPWLIGSIVVMVLAFFGLFALKPFSFFWWACFPVLALLGCSIMVNLNAYSHFREDKRLYLKYGV